MYVYFFGAAGAGCDCGFGGCFAGAGVVVVRLSKTLPAVAELLRVPKIASDREVNMKMMAAQVVALDKTVADPRGPNTVCDPIPPKAPAKSAAWPLCNSTTTIRNKHTITWMAAKI